MVEALYLAGPTGSGKTAVALALARLVPPVEVINADAYQVYRGLEIISAAPSEAERSACPHHLFGILDPSVENDAASFAKRAQDTIAEVASRALSLVVGGSGLYLKAITHGLAPTPPGDPELRAELDALTFEQLVSRYQALDPEGAAETNLKNRRYVTRNLEICLLAGRPASELKREWQRQAPPIRAVYLQRDREDLNQRIEARTRAMFAAGVCDEVSHAGELSSTASKAIGIPQIRARLAGGIGQEECIAQIAQATRAYAKRQETWFRREEAFVKLPLPAEETAEATATRIIDLFSLKKAATA